MKTGASFHGAIRQLKFHFYYYALMLWNFFFAQRKVKDCKQIPIIINNYNRLTFLRDLVDGLQQRGYTNLYIIDNNSSYPPLLEYYKTAPCTVFRLDQNLGFRAFKLSGIYKRFRRQFYVYTDSDIYLPEACPDDFLQQFYRILVHAPYTTKVGCALRIDDLPDHYSQRDRVRQWESQFWQHPIGDDCYEAKIDTTFALYKPNTGIGVKRMARNIRVAGPYACQHRPWYIDSKNLDTEEQYYISSVSQTTMWSSAAKG